MAVRQNGFRWQFEQDELRRQRFPRVQSAPTVLTGERDFAHEDPGFLTLSSTGAGLRTCNLDAWVIQHMCDPWVCGVAKACMLHPTEPVLEVELFLSNMRAWRLSWRREEAEFLAARRRQWATFLAARQRFRWQLQEEELARDARLREALRQHWRREMRGSSTAPGSWWIG